MTLVDALRRSRRASGLNLRTLAQRSGIAESNLSTIEHARRDPTAGTIDRLTAALGVRLIPVATGGRATAAETAEAIEGWLATGDHRRAYRAVVQLADDLASAEPALRLLLAAEPARTGDTEWDAFLAAVAEWRLEAAGLPTPDWVRDNPELPGRSWAPPTAVLPARTDRIAAPFSRRGILIEADELTST